MPDDAALIATILGRFHAGHRRDLPALLDLARREAPELAAPLSRIAFELEAHMRKEEEGLFPMMQGGGGNLAMAIEIMRDDHDAHLARLDALMALDAGGEDLRAALRRFAGELREHVRLENDVLFPRWEARA